MVLLSFVIDAVTSLLVDVSCVLAGSSLPFLGLRVFLFQSPSCSYSLPSCEIGPFGVLLSWFSHIDSLGFLPIRLL